MTKDPDVSVRLFGCTLKNPTILASGILGTTRGLLRRVSENDAAAVTIKSISVKPRLGHPNPTVLRFGAGLINSIGYSNPGLEKAILEFRDLNEIGCPVIGSLIGTRREEFSRLASEFDKLKFVALEVPLSCPHTPGYGKMADQDNPEAVFQIVSNICSNTSKPVLVKLPPVGNSLVKMALAAKDAGAYGITVGNTVGPAMLIEVDSGKPYFGSRMGGVSGPLLRPLVVAAIFQLFEKVDLPIIGTGGVCTGRDAIEMIMAGASAVGIGSAVLFRGLSVFRDITDEMKQILSARGVSSISDIRGAAHDS